jgi:hypothetical protein
LQEVAPPGAVQPEPETFTVPAETPVRVLPETEATPLLVELNEPPLQPEGAEAVEFWPTFMDAGEMETLPAGQGAGEQE